MANEILSASGRQRIASKTDRRRAADNTRQRCMPVSLGIPPTRSGLNRTWPLQPGWLPRLRQTRHPFGSRMGGRKLLLIPVLNLKPDIVELLFETAAIEDVEVLVGHRIWVRDVRHLLHAGKLRSRSAGSQPSRSCWRRHNCADPTRSNSGVH
jgi:hypothetical protein